MADYSRVWDFSTKTGDPILGSDVDDEFDALVTAVASKVDESREGAANGIATLGAGALVPVGISGNATSGGGQLPEATAAALGAVELATTGETTTGTDTSRAVTPAGVQAVLDQSGGLLNDISGLADPNADRIMFWDDSAGSVAFLSVGSDFSLSGTTLSLAATIATQTITTLTSTTVNATTIELGGGASITGTGTGQIEVDTQAVFSHASSNTYSSASAQIYQSTSAASGGSSGDIWFQYTA